MNRMILIVTAALLMVMLTVYAQAGELSKTKTQLPIQTQAIAALAKADCEFASEGVVNGDWKLHRILKSDEALVGANDMGTLLAQYQELRLQGECR